jgi:hypothetical protein
MCQMHGLNVRAHPFSPEKKYFWPQNDFTGHRKQHDDAAYLNTKCQNLFSS